MRIILLCQCIFALATVALSGVQSFLIGGSVVQSMEGVSTEEYENLREISPTIPAKTRLINAFGEECGKVAWYLRNIHHAAGRFEIVFNENTYRGSIAGNGRYGIFRVGDCDMEVVFSSPIRRDDTGNYPKFTNISIGKIPPLTQDPFNNLAIILDLNKKGIYRYTRFGIWVLEEGIIRFCINRDINRLKEMLGNLDLPELKLFRETLVGVLLELPIERTLSNSYIERLKYLRSLYENGNKLLTDVTEAIDNYIVNPGVENSFKIRKAIELARLMDVD